MGKLTIQEVAKILTEKNGLEPREASRFAAEMFSVILQRLQEGDTVKVKGLGTFKIINVEARESVSVRTGERVVIDSHAKVTFTPDTIMRELVNKPFSQFETVVLNDGVEFDDIKDEVTEEAAEEPVIEEPVVEKPVVEEPVVEEPEPEPVEEKPEKEPVNVTGIMAIILIIALGGVGGFMYYTSTKNSKKKSGGVDPDQDYEDEDYLKSMSSDDDDDEIQLDSEQTDDSSGDGGDE